MLFGYNRDGKKGHEQIVLGLLCNAQGCPVGVEVFPGNTQDATTVVDKIQELRRDYGLEAVTFVGDRGMITVQLRNDPWREKLSRSWSNGTDERS